MVKVKGSGGVYGPERVILDFVIMSRCLFNKAMGTRSLDCCPEPSGGRDIVAGHGGLWGGVTKRLLRRQEKIGLVEMALAMANREGGA